MAFIWCLYFSVLYGPSVALTFIFCAQNACAKIIRTHDIESILEKKAFLQDLLVVSQLPHFWKEKLQLHSGSLQLLNSFNGVSSCMTYESNAEISRLQGLLCEQDYSCKVQPNVSERQFNVLLWIPGSRQPIKHPDAICPVDAVGG